ncbi:MAG: hypothetical protein J6T94_02650 [Bacteroidaceae bacterium]|nr:hypothetical protein [Bacteroidaceae bacterium]
MNRIHPSPRLIGLSLLLLCTMGARAQAGLEYWFDSYSNPKLVPMPMAAGTIKTGLNCTDLTDGFHTLYIRAKASDGYYSPVSASTFIKFTASSDSKLEYWFDNDVDKRGASTIDIEKGENQLLELDLSDAADFPLGIHQLSMRVAAYGGYYSPVYTDLVMKLPAGSGESVLEYWFDDNYTKKASFPINILSGDVQKLELDMTNASFFPLGFHRLSMRIAAYGNQYSPIYTAYVMSLPIGGNTQLTYWLDDDYKEGRHVIAGKFGAGYGNFPDFSTTYFLSALDLSYASAGMHRLHYRITTGNGFDEGVVYEVPILVTQRYNQQPDVTVVSEEFWLDEQPDYYGGSILPQSVVIRSYTLNPNDYEEGQHAFHVQYKNSAEVWSAQNVTYFYKDSATGQLRVGKKPLDTTEINSPSDTELFTCVYRDGMIYLDCQSPKLGKTGVVLVSDASGRVIAKETVDNSDGIHAAISVNCSPRQLLIVKLISNEECRTLKLMAK